MKEIKLTKKQQEKLMEMTRALFPKYDKVDTLFEIGEEYSDISKEYIAFEQYPMGIVSAIHWFEFCLNYLVNALYENEDYKDSSEYNVNLHVDLTLSMLNYKTHPVDYLYEEYRKIID